MDPPERCRGEAPSDHETAVGGPSLKQGAEQDVQVKVNVEHLPETRPNDCNSHNASHKINIHDFFKKNLEKTDKMIMSVCIMSVFTRLFRRKP